MPTNRAEIIAQLQKEILPLQGLKENIHNDAVDVGLGKIRYAFANHQFPLGAIHEFSCKNIEQASAAGGFVSALVSALVKTNSALWISSTRQTFPPGLKLFGLQPNHIVFINVKRKKDLLSVIEESLRCKSVGAVIADAPEMNFNESRRFQLAVEESGVTGFLLRHQPKNLSTACVTRWSVNAAPSYHSDELPGIGYPRWKVELLKVRNGRPGKWEVEWIDKKFYLVQQPSLLRIDQHKKTG